MRSHFFKISMTGALLSGLVAGMGLATTTAPASAANSPITIAFVTSLTGQAAAEFSASPQAFLARLRMANAQGGVNGHKLVPMIIDDETSPTTVVTGVQDALSKGAFGIVSDSPLFFAAAKYPNEAGVPVTGGSFDGPEWGTQPYESNMFASDTGSVDPKYPVNTGIGAFLKAKGGTIVGSYGYSISPSSTRSAIGTSQSMQHAGGKTGVLDTSVPFGSVEFTNAALVAKQNKVNAVYAGMDNNSNYALATAYQQAGIKPKVVVFPTGYESDVIKSPAWQVVQGAYFDSEFRPFALPNSGTQQMQAAMQKYAGWKSSQFPNFSQYEAWLGADLMIKGLQLAGKNPTQAAVNKDLRNIKSYNGNGLLPNPINYSTIFGHDLPKACGWYMLASKNGFTPPSSMTCGTDIPGTTTVSGS
jgi:ABC-type branched-subunit amino acid transport system substrate-binding protein